jgi:hypothetical protein
MRNVKQIYLLVMFSIFYLTILLTTSCGVTGFYIKEGYEQHSNSVDESKVSKRILLIGDAGEPSLDQREPVLKYLEMIASRNPDSTSIIFLGDNIYPSGLPDKSNPNYSVYKNRLIEQVKVIQNSDATGIFIPGNHDWAKGKSNGYLNILRQENLIESFDDLKIEFLPDSGCPGPSVVDFSDDIRLIIIDSQWFFNDKLNKKSCRESEEQILLAEIKESIDSFNGKHLIIAAHHPLKSYGPHGGFFNWQAHLFPLTELSDYLWIPLPVIGSLYPLVRNLGVSDQDLSSAAYQNYIKKLESIIDDYSGVVVASGHEHTLQILEAPNENLYLVSGFGTSAHRNPVTKKESTILAAHQPGFIGLDFLSNGQVILDVYSVDDNQKLNKIFSYFATNLVTFKKHSN